MVLYLIVAVSETWLSDSDNSTLYELNGYTFVHIPRKYNKRGSVFLYIGNHLYFIKFNVLSQTVENVIETSLKK